MPTWYIEFEWFSYYIAYANSFMNPLIYGQYNKDFRNGFCMILCCRRRKKRRIRRFWGKNNKVLLLGSQDFPYETVSTEFLYKYLTNYMNKCHCKCLRKHNHVQFRQLNKTSFKTIFYF